MCVYVYAWEALHKLFLQYSIDTTTQQIKARIHTHTGRLRERARERARKRETARERESVLERERARDRERAS